MRIKFKMFMIYLIAIILEAPIWKSEVVKVTMWYSILKFKGLIKIDLAHSASECHSSVVHNRSS